MDKIVCHKCGTEFNRLFWEECPHCSGASEAHIVLQPIHLGTGEQGVARRRVLEGLAEEAGYTWGGKPSIGRWLVALADEEIKQNG